MASLGDHVVYYPRVVREPFAVRGVVFDTDGVITDTASVHAEAWKATFDDFLRTRGFDPFLPEDYVQYVDGRARVDGVVEFLTARGIELPLGNADDAPGCDTCHAIGNDKDTRFLRLVDQRGVTAYPGTLAFVDRLRAAGVATAAVSASRNCRVVLDRAGIADRFDVRVDGVDAAELDLPGKPHPALFLEAARRLGVDPLWAAVVEDALPGVEAGRRGHFGLVIGVDREGSGHALSRHGADVVVNDLAQLDVDLLGSIDPSSLLSVPPRTPLPPTGSTPTPAWALVEPR